MAQTVTRSISSVDGSLSFYLTEGGALRVQSSFEGNDSAGGEFRDSADSSLGELVTAGVLTAGERTALVNALRAIRTYHRAQKNLQP